MKPGFEMAAAAPSLGLVKASRVSVKVSEGKPWDDRQQFKADVAAAPTLFDDQGHKVLEPMPYTIKLSYHCDATACPGHRATVLDWEAGEAGRKWRSEKGDIGARADLLDKWSAMFTADKDSHVFVGNMHQHRESFSVLGVWYPPIPAQDSLL
ncbi:MAG: hypothetical protein LBI99_11165 [Propionibacteriaceae bacterium]|jgi:hypothetical protein|nr:hypothetical protein [Propionibacteriaceae bacterium]